MTKARDLANIISGGLTADDIPALPASKITSGSLGADRIPDLPTSKITSGAFADARIPDLATSKITSGTFADARLASSNVTQHVDLTALSADNLTSGTVPSARLSLSASDVPDLATSKITSGTFADARISSSSVTAHVSATTNTTGTWTPTTSSGAWSVIEARYMRIGDVCICWANVNSTSQATSNSTDWVLGGLPFTAKNEGSYVGTGRGSWYASYDTFVYVIKNTTTAYVSSNESQDPHSTGRKKNSDAWWMHYASGNRYPQFTIMYSVA